jgi:CelD/BcsL family acetyltransferase involved in cellulose biosynthesis
MQERSRKFRANYGRETSRLEASGISFRHNHIADAEHLFRMNIDAFGENSYFFDPRFLNSFEHLIQLLLDNGMLRITTVLIGSKIAAVDIGAVRNRHYTVLAGGTSQEFMGVAKLINIHHMEWACAQRLESVDFLCGDFGWKERFHLSRRPLYQIKAGPACAMAGGRPDCRGSAHE